MIRTKELEREDLEAVARLEQEIFPDAWSVKGLEESFSQKQALILGAWIEEFNFQRKTGTVPVEMLDNPLGIEGVFKGRTMCDQIKLKGAMVQESRGGICPSWRIGRTLPPSWSGAAPSGSPGRK